MAIVRKRKWRTSSGEWRTAWTADITDAKGNRERRQFATKQEADDFRIEMEGKLRSSNYRTFAASITVKQAADLFLQYCEGRMKRRERMTRHNYKGYEGHVRNYICPDPARHSQSKRPVRLIPFDAGLGENKLAQLTAGAVGNFRDDLRNAGVSVLTTRKVLGTLKLILQYAISRERAGIVEWMCGSMLRYDRRAATTTPAYIPQRPSVTRPGCFSRITRHNSWTTRISRIH